MSASDGAKERCHAFVASLIVLLWSLSPSRRHVSVVDGYGLRRFRVSSQVRSIGRLGQVQATGRLCWPLTSPRLPLASNAATKREWRQNRSEETTAELQS